jgi:hypothetical protein
MHLQLKCLFLFVLFKEKFKEEAKKTINKFAIFVFLYGK